MRGAVWSSLPFSLSRARGYPPRLPGADSLGVPQWEVGWPPGQRADNVSRDFWWPGMYGDVRRWCSKCEFCRPERGASGLSAWTRTELYSCPFRVMQFDHITCADKYVFTCVCCFSRWVWLKPVRSKSAEATA